MEILKLGILISAAVIITQGIPTLSKEITALITFATCTVILLYIIKMAVPAIEYIKNITEKISFNGMDIIVKSVGIGLITQFVSDIASDFNNKALATQMIFAGRVSILMLSIPMFMEVFKIIERLINYT